MRMHVRNNGLLPLCNSQHFATPLGLLCAVLEELKRPKLSKAEVEQLSPLEKFKYKHRKIRRRWEVPDSFPNSHVIAAYKQPMVASESSGFQWRMPDIGRIKAIMMGRCLWSEEQVTATLLPALEAKQGGPIQRSLEEYLVRYEDTSRAAAIKSKRLRQAVIGITGSELKDMMVPSGEQQDTTMTGGKEEENEEDIVHSDSSSEGSENDASPQLAAAEITEADLVTLFEEDESFQPTASPEAAPASAQAAAPLHKHPKKRRRVGQKK